MQSCGRGSGRDETTSAAAFRPERTSVPTIDANRKNRYSGLGSTSRKNDSPDVNISRKNDSISSRYITMTCQSIGRMAAPGTCAGLRSARM